MLMLDISIIVFVIMESLNVFILFFKPDFKHGNGVFVFTSYHESKKDPQMHLFVKYMTSWVAGTKLIFIVLLIVVVIFGNELTKILSVCAMILSIATYYFRLNPLIKKMDANGKIIPKGYSSTLFWMITFFMFMFSISLIMHFIM